MGSPSKWLVMLAVTAALVGCGRVSPTITGVMSADELAAMSKPKVGVESDGGELPVLDGTAATAPTGPAIQAPSPSIDLTKFLVVGTLQKAGAGFLWRKLKVTGKVTNKSTDAAITGEVTLLFKKDGKTVDSQRVVLQKLAAGGNQSFEHTSAVAADDCEAVARAF